MASPRSCGGYIRFVPSRAGSEQLAQSGRQGSAAASASAATAALALYDQALAGSLRQQRAGEIRILEVLQIY